jgi:hypothetical protein
VNYKDANDPDVRRLIFLSHSPSWMHRVTLEDAKFMKWPRTVLREWLEALDTIDSQDEKIPGTSSHTHLQWVRSLPYFNPLTYEYRLPEDSAQPQLETEVSPAVPAPSTEVIDISSAAHHSAHSILHPTNQGSQGRVLPFPRSAPDDTEPLHPLSA